MLSVKEKQLSQLEQQYSTSQEEHLNHILQLRSKIEYLEQNNHQLSQHSATLLVTTTCSSELIAIAII